MSLLSSLQVASNSLLSTQVGLQVIGNNIANANTPGYTRQEVVYTPAPTQLIANLPLGLGVQIQAIVQVTDKFVNERLRSAISDVESTEQQKETYLELEAIIGELSDTDLSSSLNRFFAAIQDVLNQPEDLAARNLVGLEGVSLADTITRLTNRVNNVREEVNGQVVAAADEINRLLSEIATLNVQIVELEGGSTTGSQAGGLRDQRSLALKNLAEFINIRSVEQPSGSITVFTNGDFLVFDGKARPVEIASSDDRGTTIATINVVDSDSPLDASSGSVAGMYAARDEVLGGFLDRIDEFARALIFEFNKVYASGQGTTGYDSLESAFQVSDTNAALDQAGLEFTPVNGTFQILVRNKRTGLTTTTDITVDLNGLDDDTSMIDLVAQMNAVDGMGAQINLDQGLTLTADSDVMEFAFANDTSGILAALGLNTFFSGFRSRDIAVNEVVLDDPSKLAISKNGIGADSENGVSLGGLATAPLESVEGLSLTGFYERITAEVFEDSAMLQALNDGFRSFQQTIEGQQLGISGVNIDEEAVKMIQQQRAFEASAKLIATINELLGTLINL